MPVELALVFAPSPLWRVERTNPALHFSLLNPVDVMNDRAGNRFDIPGAGVLYGATKADGGFAETLAGFRPRASMVQAFSHLTPEPGRILPGHVPTAWLTTRRLRTFNVTGSLPFVDLESPATHAYLTKQAAPVLLHQGLENLDVAAVRGPNRLLTRAIASWLYSRTDEHGRPLYAGIRYVSRLGDFECWAIFDGTPVELRSSAPLDPTDPALKNVIDLFGIAIP
ncbi:RES family NAD+ phosphorylase [Cryobacterium luteum]|uniref:RES domain-containing protein n=1 Tax=Cryobacterium luteum TaxID=1424661 RepID=A0A1H8LPB3_9MICO|nr:RES family NAD+ phosphorylase [Cryobacterium luteum]TFB89948.1 RES domain-containing protein [Cryobacterium luteum]SEO06965.1 RES domain-containing protein [Cryobacterium luteum]